MQVNVHEAKTQLSRSLELVEQGETVTIARHGKPVAELVRLRSSGFPLGAGRADRREDGQAAPGDEWWQPTTDREADDWVNGK